MYEEPKSLDIVIDTSGRSLKESADILYEALMKCGRMNV